MPSSAGQRTFLLLVDGDATEAERDAITEYVRGLHAEGGGWWHQLTHSWLLHTPDTAFDPGLLRDQISERAPTAGCLVMEVQPVGWASHNTASANHWLQVWWEACAQD